jgi:hypothetical protein
MTIAEFIRESVLRPRLKQAGCLVVYDADQRYREQCFDLAADKVRVVDASASSIESTASSIRSTSAMSRKRSATGRLWKTSTRSGLRSARSSIATTIGYSKVASGPK